MCFVYGRPDPRRKGFATLKAETAVPAALLIISPVFLAMAERSSYILLTLEGVIEFFDCAG